MKKTEIFTTYDKHILCTYARNPVIFVKAKGMTLTDIDGKKYLDFFPGWGVSNVGHCHPKVQAGIRDQVKSLIHMPNNFYSVPQAKLAEEIVRHSFPSKVFFCNSGAEASEAAIKFTRIFAEGKRHEIITMANSFHGRTLGALSATGQKKYQNGFSPLMEGFNNVPFNDINALKSAITDKTVAIMLELIQGEGGIHVADYEYVQKIRKICDEKKLLLICDEVQTGMGRTGEMFAYKHYNIVPDIMTLAKSLGGGLPIGAMVVKESLSGLFKPGMHASTFGGGALVCKAALGVFKAIKSDRMLSNTRMMGEYLFEQLTKLQRQFPIIREIRGKGLMLGVELSVEGQPIFEECLKLGLVINCTQGNVLRLMPALNVTKGQIHKACTILSLALEKMTGVRTTSSEKSANM